ncbi:down syndrome cell adhesion molecule-like protein, partial [Dinothrombium tinctorium]
PVKWLKEPEDIHVAMNSEITIECMAAGAPQPKIIWKRNKEVFPTVNGKFHINRVTLSDSGVYDCIADNGIDAPLMKSITIHVNGKKMKITAYICEHWFSKILSKMRRFVGNLSATHSPSSKKCFEL